jgi:hypothetical protein
VLTIFTLLMLVGPLTILGGMFATQARALIERLQAWAQSCGSTACTTSRPCR